ncbi:unnamed protein product [Schistocephalus solidus]|uniref:SAM-dependent methyltransferase n=1 Tax=Schistocephalus solidus TaxID=70667 RepID=A0A183SWH9_SCHSO|nr:unnamed protein product [Schistocephalus solidus]
MLHRYGQILPPDGLMLPLAYVFSGPKGAIELTDDVLPAFERIKACLVDATLLTHPAPEASVSVMVKA